MLQTELEVVAHFRPGYAREYCAVAWCDVEGRSERLPCNLTGKGLGPRAVFSYDVLDVADVYINTPHTYELELLNRCALCPCQLVEEGSLLK
jgi:hydrocephalus-inducing protein